MTEDSGRAGASVLRWLFRFLSALVVVFAGGAILFLASLGRAPPPPPEQPKQDIAVTSKTEVAAIGTFAGIGPRAGSCTRVLSIDGGGVRGLVPALILAEIERQSGRPIYQQFDLIVGTSTGSILALGLTRPSNDDAQKPLFAAKDLVQLYRDQGPQIFPTSFAVLRYLRRIFRPKFSPQTVEALYEKYFEDVRLHEALTNVAVPAYDIEDNRRIWFRSYASAHGEVLMRDLVRGATAAPTFFPPARFAVETSVSSSGHVALVDGALFANNPALDAFLMAQKLLSNQEGDKSLLLLSIGTGQSVRKNSFEDAWGWGVLGWMDPLLEIAFSDPAIDDQAKQELAWNKYFRLQVDLGQAPVGLDDSSPEATQKLETSTELFMKEQQEKIREVVSELSLPRSSQCGPGTGNDYEPVIGPRIRQAPVNAQ
jgi:hypothetical protein